ncbi:acyl-CoA thioester hydrolase YciA [Ferrimonas sediminicola]|uniref:Acyl-CoA thioester hydrolase YciA n=1 Tax=Ferrimonas sediminicola TaxID=2569538 RepID=A0A4U1BDE3_9GAMM|nr:acyl-CoA thioester hydrolase YciA [Ferrimonas sediminicola]TKB48762.1 acyl-CoA thioester hydrolase YciA [Ferrimonas sediminicola]
MSNTRTPQGQLLLRTLAMPADTNPNGDIFGGWIMSQMDMAGGLLAKEIARGRICTVSVDGMSFHTPVSVGDAVCVYGQCTRIGTSSMTITLEVWAKPVLKGEDERHCVTEGTFTYVAITDTGKPRPVPARD